MATDEDLLANYLAGDQAAFAELVRRYQLELFAFLQRFVSDAQVAEDLFQETFIQVHRNVRTFDPARQFRPWVFTIAANKARDYLRAAGRRGTQSLDNATALDANTTFLDLLESDEPAPIDDLTRAEDIRQVQVALAELPEAYREVLLLSYFHRFAYRDIAEMLKVPLGTVKSRLHAALAQFAKTYRRRFGRPMEN